MIERFDFSDLRELFAKANEEKSGDQLAGIAARSERERVAAKRKLADLTLREIAERPLVDGSTINGATTMSRRAIRPATMSRASFSKPTIRKLSDHWPA